jgi:hypothetical protein
MFRMKKGVWALVGAAALSASIVTLPSAFAATPDFPEDQAMYAVAYTAGDPAAVEGVEGVNFDAYNPATHPARLNPNNVLGPFDALQTDGATANQKFFGLAARTWTNYTFEQAFRNVGGTPDLEFAEVTWSSWHTEAALVYLTGAKVLENNIAVPYPGDDGYGYLAGIVWNKIGIQGLSAAARDSIAQSYLPAGVTRTFAANTFSQVGNFGLSNFYLPEEVYSAVGVTLVDITADVHGLYEPTLSYHNSGALNNGCRVTLNPGWDGTSVITSADVTAVCGLGIDGNTDGYDLDAIRVYKAAPEEASDSATGAQDSQTGFGERIKPKGTWFMYQTYTDPDPTTMQPDVCYPVQAGNPADGVRIIGEYCITDLGGGQYVVNYDLDATIHLGAWTYDILVPVEHLGIDNQAPMSFTANPGTDDNADFGVPFSDSDGMFYVFAHFEVVYQ